MQERCVQTKIDLNMPYLLRGTLFKFRSVRNQPHHRRLKHPFLRTLGRSPQIPIGLKNVRIVVVEKFSNLRYRFFRRNTRTVAPFEDRRLTPRNRLDRRVSNSVPSARKRNLPKHTHRAREDVGLIEARKPQTQIKRIAHVYILTARWAVDCQARLGSVLTREKRPVSMNCGDQQPPHPDRPRRLAWPRTSPFHGGNTGSNPVGDANLINN